MSYSRIEKVEAIYRFNCDRCPCSLVEFGQDLDECIYYAVVEKGWEIKNNVSVLCRDCKIKYYAGVA